ncbi:MAG: TetR/AcrR family transcriptional regulator [Burkholderiaceae bacterium]
MAGNPGAATRQRILASAREVVVQEGTGQLTIERVAKRAGISKGAFLYHFKSKQELLAALLDGYVEHLERSLNTAEQKFPDADDPIVPGFAEWFRKFNDDDGGSAALGIVLLAVHAHDPTMLAPLRQWYARLFKRLKSSPLGVERATSAVLAIEGFFFLHMFGLDLIEAKDKQKVLDYLTTVVSGGTLAPPAATSRGTPPGTP